MPQNNTALLEFLFRFVNDNRKELFMQNIKNRTNYITVVLEDIFQPQNASAVIRTCDCFGVQDLHIIENKNKYRINPDVALGANQWVNIFKYNKERNNSIKCIHTLKEKGYRIVATSPHKNANTLSLFNLEAGKCALFLGTEKKGLSEDVLSNADEFVTIPMFGFTESFNISVSASIIMYHLSTMLRESSIPWQLTKEEQTEQLITWAKKTLKKPHLLIKQFSETQL
ncbi:MAG: tRNA (guanosine(18)-2'-O)-methyltransferase [Bacteroidota bacterium]|nr:RNA methyltransferase [Flavobacteriales bacterium]GIK69566.1 MAG: tRNA (guanosine(18)-2'-O)-methyltransferase [Bacteroidota bacterium]